MDINDIKKLIEKVVFDNSDGGTIWQLEKYQQDNDTLPYDLVEKYKAEKEIIIFKSREETDRYINNISLK